jgi:hypothetical protein
LTKETVNRNKNAILLKNHRAASELTIAYWMLFGRRTPIEDNEHRAISTTIITPVCAIFWHESLANST